MDKTTLLITFIIEVLLVLTRLLGCLIKKYDKYGVPEDKCHVQWDLFPYSWEVDWYQKGLNVKKGAFLPPKIRDPHSRDV